MSSFHSPMLQVVTLSSKSQPLVTKAMAPHRQGTHFNTKVLLLYIFIYNNNTWSPYWKNGILISKQSPDRHKYGGVISEPDDFFAIDGLWESKPQPRNENCNIIDILISNN